MRENRAGIECVLFALLAAFLLVYAMSSFHVGFAAEASTRSEHMDACAPHAQARPVAKGLHAQRTQRAKYALCGHGRLFQFGEASLRFSPRVAARCAARVFLPVLLSNVLHLRSHPRQAPPLTGTSTFAGV